MYFRLNPECYYINGKSGGAIYDLIDEKIYRLNSQESELIEKCENNFEIDGNNGLLLQLKRDCVGNFYDKDIFIQKLRVGSPIHDNQTDRPLLIAKAFLEINNQCDQSCWFCGYYGIHRSQGCMGCNKWNESGECMEINKWKQIIDDLKDLDCQTLIFTGGDLSLIWEKTRELLEYAGNSFKNKFIILNDKKISKEFLNEIKNIANPIIQIDNIKKITRDTPYLLTLEANRIDKIQIQNYNNIAIDLLSKDFSNIDPKSPLLSKPKIRNINIFSFFYHGKMHPCLGNSITISWRGDILPCPIFREQRLGNIKENSLSQFFQNNGKDLEKFWKMHLGTIQKCGNCEFRYACDDCRALEESLTGELYGKQLCGYDPSSGTWI
jgi:radical SAM protein with 4Fe4S-binding SPASM domain